jgi:hypothetical protein
VKSVEQVKDVLVGVLVSQRDGQLVGGMGCQWPFVQGVECILGLFGVEGPTETLPDPFADTAEVSGGTRLDGQWTSNQLGLALEVVVTG